MIGSEKCERVKTENETNLLRVSRFRVLRLALTLFGHESQSSIRFDSPLKIINYNYFLSKGIKGIDAKISETK